MGVSEASDRARKGVQMTEGKQGAAEWLRGIADKYQSEDGFGCREIVEMLGFCCDDIEMCNKCRVKAMKAIADRIDAERAVPEGVEWPRFEDGELVRIGDELEFEGKTMLVCDATFYADGWALWCDREDMSGRLYGKCGERVKRPVPKVLDADGVPIEVGDTVWAAYDARRKHVVKAVCSDGRLHPNMLRIDDCTVDYEDGGWDFAKRVTHKPLDSWGQLSNDTKMGAVTYADKILGVDIMETTTEDDYDAFARDIVRRAKALAKAGEGE